LLEMSCRKNYVVQNLVREMSSVTNQYLKKRNKDL